MGGCRCMFRDCPNSSTRCPGMHFFHFPAKDKERLETWILMAFKPQFRDYPLQKLKNQNVCEEHFKINQFMNIKKERLTRFAIPTLLKLKTGQILDLEANDAYKLDWSVDSTPPTDNSVQFYTEPSVLYVPPAPPLRLNSTETNPTVVHNFQLNTVDRSVHRDDDIQITKTDDDINFEFSENTQSEDGNQQNDPNSITLTMVDGDIMQTKKIILTPVKRKLTSTDMIQKADIQFLSPVPMKKFKPMLKKVEVNQSGQKVLVPVSPPSVNTKTKIFTEVGVQAEIQTAQEKNAVVNEALMESHMKKRFEEELKRTNISHQLEVNRYTQRIKQLQDEVDELKRKLNDRPITKTTASQTAPVPTPKTPVKSPNKPVEVMKATPTASAPLSKPQLFNSVKRYLSNTMTTLLKMEIFGGGDREWKADEKKLSCEIWNLGENIYSHFIDEWRLRLPPKSNVEQWLTDCVEEDEDL